MFGCCISRLVAHLMSFAYPDATVILRFGNGPMPITLPGYNTSLFRDMTTKLENLETQIQNLDRRTTKYAEELVKWSGSVSDSVSGVCPEGQYAVRSGKFRRQGGGECKNCLIAVSAICRPLPKP